MRWTKIVLLLALCLRASAQVTVKGVTITGVQVGTTTTPPPPLGPPTGVVNNTVTLSWTQSTSGGIDSNKVYRSQVSGGPYTLIYTSPSPTTTYSDSTVIGGQTYYYVVTAVCSACTPSESNNSNETTAIVPYATLPQTWADDTVCNPPGGVYDVVKHIPGDYAVANAQQANVDWAAALDQWWHIIVTPGSILPPLTMLAKAVGANMPTKCIVWESSTPLTANQIVCTHGFQDNLAVSTDIGIRNPDCNGTGMSYQLGETITSIAAGPFTLANGTATNTSAYNDVASMYAIECNTVNCTSVTDGPADVNGNGPNHFVFRDAEIRISSTKTCCTPFSMETGSATIKGMASNYGLDRVWVHGDATDAGAGVNSLSNDIVLACGGNCWVVNSSYSKSIRPGSEGHGIYWIGSQQIKIDHNWLEGQSINVFDGGVTGSSPVGPSLVDGEVRRNRFTYPWAWLGHGSGASSVCGVNVSCVRKNSFELKGANRIVVSGNIFENSDNSGGQGGRVVGFNNRACTPNACDNYVQTMSNIVFENNIVRHGCTGVTYDANSDGSGNGTSAATPGRNAIFRYNLIYDISLRKAWNCPTNGATIRGSSSGHSFTVTSVTEDPTRTFATIQLAGGVGENQTGLTAGDPFSLSGCTDASFNVLTYPFTYASTVSGTTITYPNTTSLANASTTCTSFSNGTGWPRSILIQHDTLVGDAWISSPAGDSRERYVTIIDNIFTGTTGWSTLGGSDGTTFVANNMDGATLTAHHNAWADRIAPTWVHDTPYRFGDVMSVGSPQHNYLAVVNGTSGPAQPTLSGSLFSCNVDNASITWQENGVKDTLVSGLPPYTEYLTMGVPISPPTTLKFPRTAYTFGASAADGLSVGFSGSMNAAAVGARTCTGGQQVAPSVNSAIDLSDWHTYLLDATSTLKGAASDGSDLGVSITAIDAAQTATTYVCATYCGVVGPHPD